MATDRDTAGVIAPPPLIFAAFFLAGLAIDALFPVTPWADTAVRWAGGALVAIGIVIGIGVALQFRRANTHLEPRKPTTALVTGGLYRLSRNPAYVAVAMLYAGIALMLGKTWTLAMLAPALAVIQLGVIRREERYLERKFGDTYRAYRRVVRRWL
jgi:protein-S-isoprenylcysteine O-methyltransferase Ste14